MNGERGRVQGQVPGSAAARGRAESAARKYDDSRRAEGGPERGRGNGAPGVRSYRELRVYQAAIEAAMEIFEVSRRFPPEERASLTEPLRRASRAVCAAIGAGWRRRHSESAFVQQLNGAEAAAEEVRVWIDLCGRCRFLTEQQVENLDQRYDKITAQLVRMISEPGPWLFRKTTA